MWTHGGLSSPASRADRVWRQFRAPSCRQRHAEGRPRYRQEVDPRLLEGVDSKEVARILAPTSEANRRIAQKRRAVGDPIGLPIRARPNYLCAASQFDTQRHEIHDVVSPANRCLYVDRDSYGAASWWLTAVEVLDGNSLLADLEAGDFSVFAVGNVIDHARQSTTEHPMGPHPVGRPRSIPR